MFSIFKILVYNIALFKCLTNMAPEVVFPNQTDFAVDYCKINCGGKGTNQHTMCKYKGQGAACKEVADVFTPDWAKKILDTHNQYRNDYAAKKLPNQVLPGASNMRVFRWDAEIASIASRWAFQCSFGHDACRETETESVGQNVGYTAITAGLPGPSEQIFKSWVDESNLTTESVIKAFSTGGKKIGHFTQAAWAETYKLGCGEVTYRDGTWKKRYLVCNYATAGNVKGQPVYKIGTPCSDCPSGTKCGANPKYANLCGTDEDAKEPEFGTTPHENTVNPTKFSTKRVPTSGVAMQLPSLVTLISLLLLVCQKQFNCHFF